MLHTANIHQLTDNFFRHESGKMVAVAVVYKLRGTNEALTELQNANYQNTWEQHYLYYSLIGEIFAPTDKAKALTSFQKAIELTQSKAEKALRQKKIVTLSIE